MSADPKELIPAGPARIRTITNFPLIMIAVLILVVGGTILHSSLQKKKTGQVPPEQKTKDSVSQSRNEADEPSYLNVGHFPKAPLPPSVPDLSGGKNANAGGPKKTAAPKGPVPPPLSLPVSPLSSGGGGGGLFVSSVDGGFGSTSSSAGPSGGGFPFAGRKPILPGDLSGGMTPSGPGGARGKATAYEQTNMQSEKDRFLKDSKKSGSSDILESAVKSPVSPFEVQAGSFIHAELVTGINSDLPGEVTAQVTGNLYDSIHERFLLIPQGSKLVGKYDSKVSVGQTRILMAWERIIFPDGRSIDLSGMEGVDLEGYAGFHDLVDNHYLKIFGNAILMSLVMAGAQMSQPGGGYGMGGMNSFSNPSMGQAAMGSVGQNMSQTMEQYLGNTMNIQPTLKIRPGYRFDITVTKDMVFPGPYLVKGD
ncbi:MAG: TraB/TrbI/VirB10 family type IV secretion system protein [Leptospirales bacterium]